MVSYAQATSHHVPATAKPNSARSVHVPVTDSKDSVREWLKATEVNGPQRRNQTAARPSKPTVEPSEARRSSEPIITVVRNGKVYKSRKTPEGELNARERRKLRRAQEREAKEKLESEAGPSEEATAHEPSEGSEVGGPSETSRREEEEGIPTQPFWNDVAPAAQDAWSSYDPFTRKAATVVYSSSSSESGDLKLLPPHTILAPIPLPAHSAPSHHKRAGYPIAPPPTPTPSISSAEAEPNVVSLTTPPRTPSHSRRSSLNVDAPTFTPTRVCPLTPRSPSNSGRPRPASLNIPPPDVDHLEHGERSPVSTVSADFFTHSRKHSIALAAWEVAQRRLSETYESPEYCSTDAWAYQTRSPVNSEVEMVHSPQVHAAIPPVSPYGIGLEATTYHDIQGYGFPSPFSSPRWPSFPSPGTSRELPSPLHSPTAFSGSSRRGSHRHSLSSSSLCYSDHQGPLSPVHPIGYDRRVSVGSTGSLCSVHAEVGEDPEIDHLTDIKKLTTPDEEVLDTGDRPTPVSPRLPLSPEQRIIRPSHDRQKSRLSMMYSTDGDYPE